MTKFTENLWSDLAREHGPALASGGRPGRRRIRRPRIIASSTLVAAGAGTALALGLTATTAAPAFAVTTNSDGSVQVRINQLQALPAANRKLAAMGTGEQVTIYMAAGAAPVSGAVTCTKAPGVSGPAVKVLIGANGTEVIKPGTTGGNTGAGTWHLASCTATAAGSGNTGNTGTG